MVNLKQVIIFDCNYMCYRAHYSKRGLQTDGVATDVIYGFLSDVAYTYHELGFTNASVLFTWDSETSVRKQMCSSYKANRKNTDDDKDSLYAQIEILKEDILPSLGAQCFVQEGLEADDLMSRLALDLYRLSDSVTLVTADEDLFQMLDVCNIYNPTKQQFFTADWFQKKYHIQPADWDLVKAVAGCSSDNIKGIEGIGEKTITKYLAEELNPNTKAYQKIRSQYFDVVKKNIHLVLLPHADTKPMWPETFTKFNEDKFHQVCKDYDMKSLGRSERTWKRMIQGG